MTITKQKLKHVEHADNFTTFLLIFPIQILSEVREKSESFEGFLGGRNIFFLTYAGVTQSAIRHILKIFCLRLLALLNGIRHHENFSVKRLKAFPIKINNYIYFHVGVPTWPLVSHDLAVAIKFPLLFFYF